MKDSEACENEMTCERLQRKINRIGQREVNIKRDTKDWYYWKRHGCQKRLNKVLTPTEEKKDTKKG